VNVNSARKALQEAADHHAERGLDAQAAALRFADSYLAALASQSSPEVRILLNTNVKMSRHKAAAQAVHAALYAFGITHGRVVVLGARPAEVEEMDSVIRDAGLTELDPGTLTAGASICDG
jgi:PTH2 family peptidyl-tRNA hydrolase